MATAKNRSTRRMSRRSVIILGCGLAVALVAFAYRGPILGEAAVGAGKVLSETDVGGGQNALAMMLNGGA